MKANKKLALPLFETLKANPQHAEAHYELGMIYFTKRSQIRRAPDSCSPARGLGKDHGARIMPRPF
jgi:hypothetical protein